LGRLLLTYDLDDVLDVKEKGGVVHKRWKKGMITIKEHHSQAMVTGSFLYLVGW
jgi:hypothetical protein